MARRKCPTFGLLLVVLGHRRSEDALVVSEAVPDSRRPECLHGVNGSRAKSVSRPAKLRKSAPEMRAPKQTFRPA